MCDRCGTVCDGLGQGSGRLRLWEFPDSAHCPVIGTCLGHDDLVKIARKLKLRIDDEAHDYDVHGYFVQHCGKDCQEARAIHKLLDERHAGALRLFSRARTSEELAALWSQMKESGRIAGAFYALMTLRHVPRPFRSHVFGEVHMMSHMMGASYRVQSRKTAEIKDRLDTLETRHQRAEAGFREALAARDARIEALEAEAIELRARAAAGRERGVPDRDARPSGKAQRAIETARGRARAAEAEAASLKRALATMRKAASRRNAPASDDAAEPGAAPAPIRLDGNAILFIGGRDRQISHLRRLANEYGASLLHHDGGLEDGTNRIDEMLPSVDCVFCPIDCVSHDACTRAKAGCRKFGKTFVPLRNASKASLRQGLMILAEQRTA